MNELGGVRFIKEIKYSLFCVDELTESIKNAIRVQLSSICHGEDYANGGHRMYNYKNTLNEFLKRYESKPENIRIGMIGELLIHLLVYNYFDDLKSVTPFFNMEERSIKKGYDVVLTEKSKPILWITEVKSGKLHSNKNANQTVNELLNLAKRDLNERLNKENSSLWMEAINAAKVAFDSKNSMKEAVIEVLENWGDYATDNIYTSRDKNVILSGVLFSDFKDEISETTSKKKIKTVESEKLFKQVYIITLQKETYAKVYDFLRVESLNEES